MANDWFCLHKYGASTHRLFSHSNGRLFVDSKLCACVCVCDAIPLVFASPYLALVTNANLPMSIWCVRVWWRHMMTWHHQATSNTCYKYVVSLWASLTRTQRERKRKQFNSTAVGAIRCVVQFCGPWCVCVCVCATHRVHVLGDHVLRFSRVRWKSIRN